MQLGESDRLCWDFPPTEATFEVGSKERLPSVIHHRWQNRRTQYDCPGVQIIYVEG